MLGGALPSKLSEVGAGKANWHGEGGRGGGASLQAASQRRCAAPAASTEPPDEAFAISSGQEGGKEKKDGEKAQRHAHAPVDSEGPARAL
jgi:hypothetical protein